MTLIYAVSLAKKGFNRELVACGLARLAHAQNKQ